MDCILGFGLSEKKKIKKDIQTDVLFLYFFVLKETAWQKVAERSSFSLLSFCFKRSRRENAAKRNSFSLLISFCIRRNCLAESRGA